MKVKDEVGKKKIKLKSTSDKERIEEFTVNFLILRLFLPLPSSLLLPEPLPGPWLLPLAMPPQTLLSPQCTITSMVSVMTTVEQTSSRLRPEMVTQPLAATLLLFLMAGSRLSSTLTMETESSRM